MKTLIEPSVKKTINNIRGDIFIDIGANIGEYTLSTWRHFKKTISVEPNMAAETRLRERIGWRSWFHDFRVLQFAVSDTGGQRTKLHLNRDGVRCNGSADTIEPVFRYRPASHPEIDRTWDYSANPTSFQWAETITLDDLCDLPDTRIIDLVKIDTEGHEFAVLKGGPHAIDRIRRIVVELHDRERKQEMTETVSSEFDEVRWIDEDHVYGEKR